MIHSIDVQVTTPINPTERRDRLDEAIHNLFPGAEIEERHGELIATTHSLDRFAERLHEQQIGPTARERFYENQEGNAFSFDLKKAAAFEGVVNFAVGKPDELGDLHVRVRVEETDVDALIEHLVSGETDENATAD